MSPQHELGGAQSLAHDRYELDDTDAWCIEVEQVRDAWPISRAQPFGRVVEQPVHTRP